MNKLATVAALAIAALGLTIAPAHAAEGPAVQPPSVVEPTCSNRLLTYTIPWSDGVEYDVTEGLGAQVKRDVLPGTYTAGAGGNADLVVVRVTARAAGTDEVLKTWTLDTVLPLNCPATPRPLARIVGGCKTWEARLRVAEVARWQVAPTVDFDVEVDGREFSHADLTARDMPTAVGSGFKRGTRAHVVKVYADDELIGKRKIRCRR